MKLREMISWASTGVVLCCAIAALTLPIFGPDSAKKTGELAISLVSAIGTLAAVIVALYLGHQAGAQARAAARVTSAITANKLYTQVVRLFDAVEHCREEVASEVAAQSVFRYLPNRIVSTLSSELISFDHEDLIRMSSLPDRCAVRIASLAGQLERLKLDCIEAHPIFISGFADEPTARVQIWGQSLEHVSSELAAVIDIFNDAKRAESEA